MYEIKICLARDNYEPKFYHPNAKDLSLVMLTARYIVTLSLGISNMVWRPVKGMEWILFVGGRCHGCVEIKELSGADGESDSDEG